MALKAGKWLMYHVVDGEIVVDEADHTDHHRQAHAAMGLPEPKYIAGSKDPLTREQMDAYTKQYGMPFNLTKRKHLPEFVEPLHWKWQRERTAKALKAKEERMKKNGSMGKS